MAKIKTVLILALMLLGWIQYSFSQSDDFILIKGAEFRPGTGEHQDKPLVRIEDFEMLDHPVTNTEYELFVKATGHRTPHHWAEGEIPKGKEDFPVIFVDRLDAKAYLEWRSRSENRLYRLPSVFEFEYASRGGLRSKKYPWGNGNPNKHANYDAKDNRKFDAWEDYLEPVKNRKPNGYGLYGMTGNMWQLCVENRDPATTKWKYRIDDLTQLERAIMGGSWARSASYLQNGYVLEASPGFRHPDLGFRPVREPKGAQWQEKQRKLSAVPLENGYVHLSWALLKTDKNATAFNVYRSTSRAHSGFLVNRSPITSTTNFMDTDVEEGTLYFYYVRLVMNGAEGRRSDWASVTATKGTPPLISNFKPVHHGGSLVPVFGDLNGDGTMDCVVRMGNGIKEMSQDPGVDVQMEAFTANGRSLWRKNLGSHASCYGSANNMPFNVWDMDGDNRAEIITRLQIRDSVYVAILDGMTGVLKHKAPWPEMISDHARSSTRIHLSIAYLDGKNPAVVTQTGLYENEVLTAYDAELKQLWQFKSLAETSGSGGHKIEVADVDGDGAHEVFDGTTCLNSDGTVRWSIYRLHPDVVSIQDYLPDRPGLEVFYIIESSIHAGVYMVNANTGEVIWKVNREDDPRWLHAHHGWTADIWEGSRGIECISNRAGHADHHLVMFSADGQILKEPFPFGCTPLEWDGDDTRELFLESRIGNYNGNTIIPAAEIQPKLPQDGQLLMAADLYGDFRDELVMHVDTGGNASYISVIPAIHSTQQRYVARTETLGYRLWLSRNIGGGYKSVYDQKLVTPKK